MVIRVAASQLRDIPPLLGDGQGSYRIRVLGNSGSGKSTLSRQVASILKIPYLSLDELYWQPGWKTTPYDEFRDKIVAFMQTNKSNGWVIEGEYARKGAAVAQEHATDIIWLDPPLLLYFPRLVLRTVLRLVGLESSCSPGCPESVRDAFFSKSGILWWCLHQHRVVIERHSALMKIWGLEIGSKAPEEQKMRRLGGWGSEVKDWLQSVREMPKNT
ncbi:AAA domain-containing protein [Lentinula edodes]|nr:AAA domain-containing protein [Lentinula edodes]